MANASFESQALSGGWAQYADEWFSTDYWGTFVESELGGGIPDTPYGDNWGGVDSSGTLYQPVGTWDENMQYDITIMCGQRAANDFGGFYVSLSAGADPADTALDGLLGAAEGAPALDTIGGTTVDEVLVTPASFVGNTNELIEEVTISLTTGTGLSTSDHLWIMLTDESGKSWIDNIRIAAATAAVLVGPPDGAPLVALGTDLEWGPSPLYTPTGYDVYFGTDPNVADNPKVVDNALVTSYSPTLVNDKTYYWRVDSYDSTVPTVYEGNAWSFTTAPATPVVTEDPAALVVAAGDDAVFTVAGLNQTDYQWYKYVDGISDTPVGTNSDTLTITGVQLGDEGFYYCELSNASGSQASEAAGLWTKRLAGHWKLDGTLADSVAETVTGAPAHDGVAVDPNFVTEGINGNSYRFYGDGKIIEVLDSADFFDFYPQGYTVSAWVKMTQAGYGAYVAKQDKSAGNKGFILGHYYGYGLTTLRESFNDLTSTEELIGDDQWHLVVGMYDLDTGIGKIYIDGELNNQTDPDFSVLTLHDEPLFFGAETTAGDVPYEGLVDDIRIWTYPVDSVDIGYLYYDFTSQAVCVDGEGLEYDFNDDCIVNLLDFADFAATWLNCRTVPDCN